LGAVRISLGGKFCVQGGYVRNLSALGDFEGSLHDARALGLRVGSVHKAEAEGKLGRKTLPVALPRREASSTAWFMLTAIRIVSCRVGVA
jgi:hypothetical protein